MSKGPLTSACQCSYPGPRPITASTNVTTLSHIARNWYQNAGMADVRLSIYADMNARSKWSHGQSSDTTSEDSVETRYRHA
jgi:hypothetical protein